jgi:hypothetical protein
MAKKAADPIPKTYRVSRFSQTSPRNLENKQAAVPAREKQFAEPKGNSFPATLDALLSSHGETELSLLIKLGEPKAMLKARSVSAWRKGRRVPSTRRSQELLERIEKHFSLERGYFAQQLAVFRPSFKSSLSVKISAFQSSLNHQMRLHQDSSETLANSVRRPGEGARAFALTSWKTGRSIPRSHSSFELLNRVERKYALSEGHFVGLLAPSDSIVSNVLRYVRPGLRPDFFWHLPSDFETRTKAQQSEIVRWIVEHILGKSTEFGRYQAKATSYGFSVQFKEKSQVRKSSQTRRRRTNINFSPSKYKTVQASRSLMIEMKSLLDLQTATIAPEGFRRLTRWSGAMADKTTRQFGLFLGALHADPQSPAAGRGVHMEKLTLGLLAFPSTINWYMRWRERRRGFYSTSETSLLYAIRNLLRKNTGWIRQHPELARKVRPISGLLTHSQISRARKNWKAWCDIGIAEVDERIQELRGSVRVHRDTFEAVMPVLEAESPLQEYKKIADEILKLMPDEEAFPLEAAIANRSYLMLRLGMHLVIRQRNLRELLICPVNTKHTSNSKLQDLRRGELRWVEAVQKWEVYIPSVAFKNAKSTFFRGQPFRLTLPDLNNLYLSIEQYIDYHRPLLLGANSDPGTFFVKNGRTEGRRAEFSSAEFYLAWKTIIRRYGIHNPYTGQGAIAGLLPHGPHNIRDVVATHILRRTGSYELASFAIQDTVEAVTRHYGRFLPQEKSARSAAILNEVWQT